jgi:hypothetical protein
MNRKQQSAFPEVGTIHKGKPKEGNRFGADLNERFRVEFAPDTIAAQTRFYAAYDTYHPTKIRGMIASMSVWDSWYFANETYTSGGQLIAAADDDHFLHLRNPVTGELLVRKGEPFKEYVPGQAFAYQRGDRKFEAKLKPSGRLSLFLPELEKFVVFTLKTSSFYDRINIEKHLAAIQGLANALNNGNAAGIPIRVYRRQGWVTWNKPGGGAIRSQKWLVNIEPDPAWAKQAMKRLSNFAIFGAAFADAEVTVDGDPALDDEDEEEGLDVKATAPGDWV